MLSFLCAVNGFAYDPGEMQGTVHRRLLEDRQGELKIGAVLLLKQVRHLCTNPTALLSWIIKESVRCRRPGGRVFPLE